MFVNLVQVLERTFLEKPKRKTVEGKTGEIIQSTSSGYSLQEVIININNILYLKDDLAGQILLEEDKLPENLHRKQEFTKLFMNSGSNSVSSLRIVGPKMSVLEKILQAQNRK